EDERLERSEELRRGVPPDLPQVRAGDEEPADGPGLDAGANRGEAGRAVGVETEVARSLPVRRLLGLDEEVVGAPESRREPALRRPQPGGDETREHEE